MDNTLMEHLYQLTHLPEGLIELPAKRLHELLPQPTLITLDGLKKEPLFISVLLHGNEDTGWDALRSWIKDNQHKPLPRTLVIFMGNIDAAKQGLRRLDGQPDYNRIWKGRDLPEERMAAKVIATVAAMKPFAAIDLHNNTGTNPHYACINQLDTAFLHLALLFGRTIIYFTQPDSVLSRAFADICPSITVEAGKPGEEGGLNHCKNLIQAAMHLHHFPEHKPSNHDYDVFQTKAIVHVNEGVTLSIQPEKASLQLRNDLDKLNFSELPKHTVLGLFDGNTLPLSILDEEGKNIVHNYFSLADGQLCTNTPLMPSMLTLNTHIIQQDCLCYLMQRISPHTEV